MYCSMLKEILGHEESKKHKIDKSIIRKLDLYLRKKVSIFELENINPCRFSNEMRVDFETTLRLFAIAKKVGLFESEGYYHCTCGEKFKVLNMEDRLECPSGHYVIPLEDKDRVYIFFSLKYSVEACSFLEGDIGMADILTDDSLGKANASYSDYEEVIGDEGAKDLMQKTYDEKLNDYLKG